MSYFPAVDKTTPIIADVIKAGTPTSASVNGRFGLSGTITGSSSISNNQLLLPSGSSYSLEGSVLVRCADANGAIEWQWYDVTNAQYIGGSGFMNLATSFGSVARVSRRVAHAFVPSSEAGITVELRIKSLTGSGWNLTIDASGIGGFNYVGYPSARVLELPN